MAKVKTHNRYLDMVDHPAHVKKLTVKQLEKLAEELREELINGLAKNGGHLGPNLGVVELTLAMHRVFETPRDKFVWDVSHQSYVHKLLTGRKERFRTIRTTDGLNGFALRTESEHDSYGAGHAGTALSAALGMAAARDQRGSDENVVCVFGDAALTNGISFEALNNIAHTTKKFVGILNDNEWSIAKNVGAISTYLNKLITNPGYNKITRDLQKFISKVPSGKLALRLGLKGQEALKGTVTQAALQHNEETLDSDGRGGFVHQQLATRMLSDLHGVQARGGCACAGPYVHRLLGIGAAESRRLRTAILRGDEIEKPGFVRLNLCWAAPEAEIDAILSAMTDLARHAAEHLHRYRCDPATAIFTPVAA